MRDENVEVVVPDEPLDTTNPAIAKALLGLLERYRQNHASIPAFTDSAIYGNRECSKRERGCSAPYEPVVPGRRLRVVEVPAGPEDAPADEGPADGQGGADDREELFPGLLPVLRDVFGRAG